MGGYIEGGGTSESDIFTICIYSSSSTFEKFKVYGKVLKKDSYEKYFY